MRLRDLLREAALNTWTGVARPAVLFIVTVIPVVAIAGLEGRGVNHAQRDALAFRDSGAAVYVLRASGAVDGAMCDTLNDVQGVERAGAVRAVREELVPASTPDGQIPLFQGTDGFAELLGADFDAGALIEAQVSDRYGTTPGEIIATIQGGLPVGSVYAFPDDGRLLELQYAAVVPGTQKTRYDECWMETWPYDERQSPLLYSALTPGPAPDDTSIVQLNPTHGASLVAREDFVRRASRFGGYAALAWAAITVIAVSRLRRLELSFARHLGASKSQVVLLLVFECLLMAMPLIATAVCVLAWARANTLLTAEASMFAAVVLAMGLAGAVAGSTIAGLLSRETTLFDYFKRR